MAHTATPMNSGTLRKALNINTDFVSKHQESIKKVYPEKEEIGHKIKTLTNHHTDKNKLSFDIHERNRLLYGRVIMYSLNREAWEEKKVLIEDLVNLQAIDFREWSSDLFEDGNYKGGLFIYTKTKNSDGTVPSDREYYRLKDSATVSESFPDPNPDEWERLTNLDSGTLSTYASEEANFQTNIVRNGVISWALERLGNDMGYEQEAWNEYYDVVDSGIDIAESGINLFRALWTKYWSLSEKQCLVRLENGHTVVMAADDAKGMNVIGELSLTDSDENLLKDKLKNMNAEGHNPFSLIGSHALADKYNNLDGLKTSINRELSQYRVHLYEDTEDENKISYYYRIQEDLPAVSGEVYLVNNDWRYVARDIYHSMSKIDIPSDKDSRFKNVFSNFFSNGFSTLFSSEGAEFVKSIASCSRQFTEYRFSNANRALTHAADCTDTVPAIMQQNSSILAGGHYIDSNGYVLDIEEKDAIK